MKFALMGFGFVTVFTLSLIGTMAATGNLNQDAVNRLMGKEVEQPAPAAGAAHGAAGGEADAADPITRQLQKQRAELEAKEKELKEYEAQLNQRASELDALYNQVQTAKAEFEAAVGEAEKKHAEEIETVANTVAAMKPTNAAERLASMPVPDVVEVLRKVKDKNRGKIVEAMEPEAAAEVLRKMQEMPTLSASAVEPAPGKK